MNNSHMLLAMQEMLFYTVIAVCIITVPTLIVGLVISIFQAGTQINEMTLTFIPKLIVMFGLLFLISPWLMNKLVLITKHYLQHLPTYIR
ncbi:MAG: flagellar biosynthetic protein FliQ [Gammaproteobacteria bacterium]